MADDSRNAYARHYRRTHPEYRAREKRYAQLRQRALEQLMTENRARFLEIFDALRAIDQTTPKDHAQ